MVLLKRQVLFFISVRMQHITKKRTPQSLCLIIFMNEQHNNVHVNLEVLSSLVKGQKEAAKTQNENSQSAEKANTMFKMC